MHTLTHSETNPSIQKTEVFNAKNNKACKIAITNEAKQP